MATFETPGPIAVKLEIGIGTVTLLASDRPTTEVEVRPSDPGRPGAAQQTLVEQVAGQLLVKSPKSWRHYALKGGRDSVDVVIELPSGSTVTGETGVVTLRTEGRLADLALRSGMGEISVDEVGVLRVKGGMGGVRAERVAGSADLKLGSGQVDIGHLEGAAVVKNANGDTRIGTIGGDLRVQSANGRITVGHTSSSVVAKTSNGDIRVGVGPGGMVEARTARGRVEVEVWDGVPVWLDLQTQFGRVHNELDEIGAPGSGATAEVRASTAFGDIVVRRGGQGRPEGGAPIGGLDAAVT